MFLYVRERCRFVAFHTNSASTITVLRESTAGIRRSPYVLLPTLEIRLVGVVCGFVPGVGARRFELISTLGRSTCISSGLEGTRETTRVGTSYDLGGVRETSLSASRTTAPTASAHFVTCNVCLFITIVVEKNSTY